MANTAKKNFGGGNTAWEEKTLSKYEFRWVAGHRASGRPPGSPGPVLRQAHRVPGCASAAPAPLCAALYLLGWLFPGLAASAVFSGCFSTPTQGGFSNRSNETPVPPVGLLAPPSLFTQSPASFTPPYPSDVWTQVPVSLLKWVESRARHVCEVALDFVFQ